MGTTSGSGSAAVAVAAITTGKTNAQRSRLMACPPGSITVVRTSFLFVTILQLALTRSVRGTGATGICAMAGGTRENG